MQDAGNLSFLYRGSWILDLNSLSSVLCHCPLPPGSCLIVFNFEVRNPKFAIEKVPSGYCLVPSRKGLRPPTPGF